MATQRKSKRPFYRYRDRYGRFAVKTLSNSVSMKIKTQPEVPEIIIVKEEELPPKIPLTLPIHFIVPDSMKIEFAPIKDNWINLGSNFNDFLSEKNIELTVQPELDYVDDDKYYNMKIFKPEEFIANEALGFFIISDFKKFGDEFVSVLPIKKIRSAVNYIAVPIYDLTPEKFKPEFLSIALLREFFTFLASSRNNDDLESQMEDIDIHSGTCVRKYKHNVNQTQKSITARVNALIKARYSHTNHNLCNNCIKKLEKPFFKFLSNLGITSIEIMN